MKQNGSRLVKKATEFTLRSAKSEDIFSFAVSGFADITVNNWSSHSAKVDVSDLNVNNVMNHIRVWALLIMYVNQCKLSEGNAELFSLGAKKYMQGKQMYFWLKMFNWVSSD